MDDAHELFCWALNLLKYYDYFYLNTHTYLKVKLATEFLSYSIDSFQ